LSITVRNLAINKLWSQKTSFKMCTAATVKHDAVTTLPLITAAARGCVMHLTTTLNMAKSRILLKKFLAKSNLLLCLQCIKFFIAIFQQLSCFPCCKGSIRRHLPAKTAFSTTSWLH